MPWYRFEQKLNSPFRHLHSKAENQKSRIYTVLDTISTENISWNSKKPFPSAWSDFLWTYKNWFALNKNFGQACIIYYTSLSNSSKKLHTTGKILSRLSGTRWSDCFFFGLYLMDYVRGYWGFREYILIYHLWYSWKAYINFYFKNTHKRGRFDFPWNLKGKG